MKSRLWLIFLPLAFVALWIGLVINVPISAFGALELAAVMAIGFASTVGLGHFALRPWYKRLALAPDRVLWFTLGAAIVIAVLAAGNMLGAFYEARNSSAFSIVVTVATWSLLFTGLATADLLATRLRETAQAKLEKFLDDIDGIAATLDAQQSKVAQLLEQAKQTTDQAEQNADQAQKNADAARVNLEDAKRLNEDDLPRQIAQLTEKADQLRAGSGRRKYSETNIARCKLAKKDIDSGMTQEEACYKNAIDPKTYRAWRNDGSPER